MLPDVHEDISNKDQYYRYDAKEELVKQVSVKLIDILCCYQSMKGFQSC